MSDHHEAWGRVPQILEDILAQDAHAPVRIRILYVLTVLNPPQEPRNVSHPARANQDYSSQSKGYCQAGREGVQPISYNHRRLLAHRA